MTERQNGLCTWALRTMAGSYLANDLGTTTTCFVDQAHCWLWHADEAQDRATELAPKIGREKLTAVRAR